MFEECIVSPRRVCPSPRRQRTRPILNWAWLKNGPVDSGSDTQWCQRLLIHVYFGASGSHRPKRGAYVKRVLSFSHTLAPTGSGSEKSSSYGSRLNKDSRNSQNLTEALWRWATHAVRANLILSVSVGCLYSRPERVERSVFCSQTAGGRVLPKQSCSD